jgi:hypothetical protein
MDCLKKSLWKIPNNSTGSEVYFSVAANHPGIKQALQARAGLYHNEYESVQSPR